MKPPGYSSITHRYWRSMSIWPQRTSTNSLDELPELKSLPRLLLVALEPHVCRQMPPVAVAALLARFVARYRTVEGGMAHQGYHLLLTRYDKRGWGATFYTTGMEHSSTSAI